MLDTIIFLRLLFKDREKLILTEKRLDTIETKIAYQEQTISELNSVIIEQQKTIDRLEKTLKTVTDKIREIADSAGSDKGTNSKPPHY